MISKRKLFRNKKAIGAEVDWIIAGGIFLIYLLMVLVYFKPGLNPVFNPDNLLDIVESGFETDSYWTITTQPMFVEAIKFKNPDPNGSPSDVSMDLDLYNGEGNSLCVEFKGELGSTTEANFPLNLKSSKSKLFFVGAKTTEKDAGAKEKTDRDNQQLAECNTIDQKITDIESEIETLSSGAGGQGSKSDCLSPLGGDERCQIVKNACIDGSGNFQSGQYLDEGGTQYPCSSIESEYINCNKCKQAMSDLATYKIKKGNCPNQEISKEDNINIDTSTIEKDYREGYLDFSIDSNNNLNFIPLFIDQQKTKYVLTYSSEDINKELNPNTCSSPIIPDYACIIKGTPVIPSVCHAKYELGVSETVKGISLTKLMGLALSECNEGKTKGYECVKNEWGYPALKDFKIRIYTKENVIAEFPKEPIIPTNINVYSRQFNSFILNEDGLREAVTVNILVW